MRNVLFSANKKKTRCATLPNDLGNKFRDVSIAEKSIKHILVLRGNEFYRVDHLIINGAHERLNIDMLPRHFLFRLVG